MNVERNVLAVIPARGGSKGIPRKNMRLMHGRPLIDYAISCAAESSCITDVAVSTDSRDTGFRRTDRWRCCSSATRNFPETMLRSIR
ncbi:MAG: cytidylyltransferase domain-containing protein [Collinsella sp.]